MSFDSLGLRAELLRAVGEEGYTEPTPIQVKAIPIVLEGHDLLAGAQTGTGKTAGFTLPMLQRLAESEPRRSGAVRALVLTPTRELAAQVGESVENYGRHLDISSTVIFGGVNINPQTKALKRGVDVLVATPGRLLDHAGQGHVDLSDIEILVLDEADRMLDMGFIHDIKRVLKLLPEARDRQSLLFSATFPQSIRDLAARILDNPDSVDVAPRNSTAERVSQKIHPVPKNRKRELLSHIVGSNNWQQVLVFTRTKHGANRLARQLETDGLTAAAIHGNRSQAARTRALDGFKNGTVRVLVATDIAARGIDIDQLPHVVNFELPNVPEDYVHRIGRTGRAGSEGEAISLVSPDEAKQLAGIERLLGRAIESEVLPGYEKGAATPEGAAENPKQARRRGRGDRDQAAVSGQKEKRNGRPQDATDENGKRRGRGQGGKGRNRKEAEALNDSDTRGNAADNKRSGRGSKRGGKGPSDDIGNRVQAKRGHGKKNGKGRGNRKVHYDENGDVDGNRAVPVRPDAPDVDGNRELGARQPQGDVDGNRDGYISLSGHEIAEREARRQNNGRGGRRASGNREVNGNRAASGNREVDGNREPNGNRGGRGSGNSRRGSAGAKGNRAAKGDRGGNGNRGRNAGRKAEGSAEGSGRPSRRRRNRRRSSGQQASKDA
ncbi:MAG: DEAD/DEAH box helicase [Pseudomonadota bacterium]